MNTNKKEITFVGKIQIRMKVFRINVGTGVLFRTSEVRNKTQREVLWLEFWTGSLKSTSEALSVLVLVSSITFGNIRPSLLLRVPR